MRSVVAGIEEVITIPRPKMPAMPEDWESEPKAKVKIEYSLSNEQQELREIRLKMGMTKSSFSTALQIKQCTLDSYEYGKTKGVPNALITSARKLLKESENSVDRDVHHAFANKSMSEILSGWATKLEIPITNSAMLGRVLDSTPITIRRWRDDKVRPDPRRLAMLASLVESGAENATQIIAIQAVKRLRKTSAESNGFCFIPSSLAKEVIDKVASAAEDKKTLNEVLELFKSELERCKTIPGRNGFYQMTATAMQRHTRNLVNELNGTIEGDEPKPSTEE